MPDYWKDKSVLISGGNDFLGERLASVLRAEGSPEVRTARALAEDASPGDLFRGFVPHTVFHVCRDLGGALLGSGTLVELRARTRIRIQRIADAAEAAGVRRFLALGHCDALQESGNGMQRSCFILPEVYGPGGAIDRESTSPAHRLVAEFMDALLDDASDVMLHGKPDQRLRLLHVDDAARAIIVAAGRDPAPEHGRLMAGESTTLQGLAELLVKITHYRGRLEWDHAGDPETAARFDPLEPADDSVDLETGIQQTLHDYRTRVLETPNQWQRPPELHAHNNHLEDDAPPEQRPTTPRPGDPEVLFDVRRNK